MRGRTPGIRRSLPRRGGGRALRHRFEESLERMHRRLVAEQYGSSRNHLFPQFREARAVNPVPRRLCDTEAARHLIGFETSIPLEDGLRELVEWWQGERQSAAVAEAIA